MKFVCAPEDFAFAENDGLNVVLYGQGSPELGKRSARGSAGKAAMSQILRARLNAAPRAWDFLSIALAVVTADVSEWRSESPDGWTRKLDLTIAVIDPEFWNTQARDIEAALQFLSTDRWRLRFVAGGLHPVPPRNPIYPLEDCVALLSGGLDSLVGAIDLAAAGKKPFAVSNVVRGDGENQTSFAEAIGGGLRHLPLNHNAKPPWRKEDSQRARSLIFIAFGVLAATTLRAYHDGANVPFFVCENGFIAINPPLTGTRLGSLSTRTAHPEFLNRIRDILSAADLRIELINPYEHATKGEMLAGCKDQSLLRSLAAQSVSCGRYRVFNYNHCGRCIPCQVRRAAFLAWNGSCDTTYYRYDTLGQRDSEHAHFDDVRSLAMALREVKTGGLNSWLGAALSYPRMGDPVPIRDLVKRGLAELGALHDHLGVK
ncbi:Qat anti-phage system QueC-like protein QatC [Erythrobacter sp.]|jgi:hypothetical protein|uniref:Qat anti-phage system QueC-like protein QatC n=1 Tax=Erythrobacter sp. TaxID=1042 RepID=UPI002EC0243F|nr:Qat anti-phage system QueC-like protein QatC [Erythrobacter sp.]